MKLLKLLTPANRGRTVSFLLASAGMFGLLLWHLGSLTHGLSLVETTIDGTVYGWNGLLHNPFFLPLAVVRSIVYSLLGHDTPFLTRLPSTIFGYLAVLCFGLLIRYWQGSRSALFGTALFATSAWVLHVSRLASNDVLYLLALPLLLVVQLAMLKRGNQGVIFYGSLLVCGAMLYVPGLIWFVILSLYWQRTTIAASWRRFGKRWQRVAYILSGLVWLPLLGYRIAHLKTLLYWLGLPAQFDILEIGRQLLFVPVHLFIRGPYDPQRWLGHAPILDLFTVAMAILGLWFYITHMSATRSRVLGSYAILGVVMVGLGGAVTLSVMVPLMFIFAATGMAYLLHDWLRVFPLNPVARRAGIGLLALAVAVSCLYNVRSYYVAWPHSPSTLTLFTAKK